MEPLDIERLLTKAVAPKENDRFIFIYDVRSEGGIELSDGYIEMAERWKRSLIELGRKIGFSVREYAAALARDSEFPPDILEEVKKYDCVVSMMHFKGLTAKLRKIAKETGLRGVNMPGVIPEMEDSFFRADIDEMEELGGRIKTKLENSLYAKVKFSTGHELILDLRYRTPAVSSGKNTERGQVGNLASGEVYITPNEASDSLTEGELPIYDEKSGETIVCKVKANRIYAVEGRGKYASEISKRIAENPERGNVAELGIGINKKAVKRGIAIEDEKMEGIHIGRESGYVNCGSVIDTGRHYDEVYSKYSKITATLTLLNKDYTEEVIVKDSLLQIS